MSQNNTPTFLEFLPVSLFGAVMGLTALCFAWRIAGKVWHVSGLTGEIIGALAILVFILLTTAYIAKWIRHRPSVTREFQNPVSLGFFGTVTISVMLIPGILLPYTPALAGIIWLAGVGLT